MTSTSLHEDSRRRFEARFGCPPTLLVRAPGRINLIGEHTDYQGGHVLPAAIDREILIAARPDPGGAVEVHSDRLGHAAPFAPDDSRRTGGWTDLVRGVLAESTRASVPIDGFRALIGGHLPTGAGMSSSAAVGVGFATLVRALAEAPHDPRQAATIAHRAETDYLGVPCGIMDPLACALGRPETALHIDCRATTVEPIRVAPELGEWVAFHSGVSRELRRSDYATRTKECADCVREIQREDDSIRSLRDVTLDRLEAVTTILDGPLLRRARHVVTENQRVLSAIQALRDADAITLGARLDESHRSLRDDFEVSHPALDTLVDIAREEGALGSRMMGAGFGGCTLSLVPTEIVDRWTNRVEQAYRARSGQRGTPYRLRLTTGASVER